MNGRIVSFRLAVEIAVAVVVAGLGLTTIVWHDWAEAIFGVDPDQGSGGFEIAVTVLLAAAALTLAFAARVEWRHRLARSGT